MDWHLTWQDPVALALVVVCLGAAWWLRRRLPKAGCSSCAKVAGPGTPAEVPAHPGAAPGIIPLASLRLGRRPGAAHRK